MPTIPPESDYIVKMEKLLRFNTRLVAENEDLKRINAEFGQKVIDLTIENDSLLRGIEHHGTNGETGNGSQAKQS